MTARAARILALVLVAVAAYLSAAHTWASLNALANPDLVLRFQPRSSDALREAADRAFVAASATSADEVSTLAARLLRQSPLDEAPLIYTGFMAAAIGDFERADAAMEQAITRDPRNRVARAWLVDRAREKNDYGAAIDHVAALRLIDPANRPIYLDTMAAIALNPAAQGAVLDRTDPWPEWGNALVTRLSTQTPDLDFLLKLSANGAEEAHRRFLDRLIRGHGYARAYVAWLEHLPDEQRQNMRWPHNASFQKGGGYPPFNWRVLSNQAEILAEGGLHATFLGREDAKFAEQIMLLPPGAYRFEAALEGRLIDRSGVVLWSVDCARGRERLGSAPLLEVGAASVTIGFDFVVPEENCPAQRLMFHGEPGDFPRMSRVLTRSVHITKLPAVQDEG